MRFIVALILGLSAGYFIGWNDARKNTKHIVERLVDRAGGNTRSMINNNADSLLKETSDPNNKR